MIWATRLARTADRRGAQKVLFGKRERKNHFEDLDVDGTIILKQTFKKLDGS